MRKKMTARVLATLGVATALIAGNGVMSAYASSNTDAQEVKVIAKQEQPDIAGPGSEQGIINKDLPVSEKVAVVTAEEAVQEKFQVSLSGFKISYDLGTRVDKEGQFYFVTFVEQKYEYSDEELLKAKKDLKDGKDIGIGQNDIYTAFVNAETGEIDSVEKNWAAPKGAN